MAGIFRDVMGNYFHTKVIDGKVHEAGDEGGWEGKLHALEEPQPVGLDCREREVERMMIMMLGGLEPCGNGVKWVEQRVSDPVAAC